VARVYLAARDGERDVADASRLANMLSIIARTLEGAELERRIGALENRG
jgi:hypothetical protein